MQRKKVVNEVRINSCKNLLEDQFHAKLIRSVTFTCHNIFYGKAEMRLWQDQQIEENETKQHLSQFLLAEPPCNRMAIVSYQHVLNETHPRSSDVVFNK